MVGAASVPFLRKRSQRPQNMPISIPQVMLVIQRFINAYILIKTLGRNKIITSLYQSITKISLPPQPMGAHRPRLGHFIRYYGRANHSHWVNFNGRKGGRGINGKA